VVDIITSCN